MIKRNTRQKEIILECIKENCTHPTITEIMERVNEKDPNVGQATVYRNINKMLEEGLIDKVYSARDTFHYDADTREHDHLICTRCGKIIDLFDSDYTNKKKDVTTKYSFQVEKVSTVYKGICSDCQKIRKEVNNGT